MKKNDIRTLTRLALLVAIELVMKAVDRIRSLRLYRKRMHR